MKRLFEALLSAAAVLALVGLARPAAAAESGGWTDVTDLGTHQKHLRLELGNRTQFVDDAGLDPFSQNDVIAQLALGASWSFYANEQLSVAGVLGFDYGELSARARSNETSLDLRRFTLGPEARYHVLRVLALTAKLAPTLTREAALVSSGVDPDLKKVAWKFGFDATAGAAVEVLGFRAGGSHKPRLWVTGEGGYGWTSANRLEFQPTDSAAAPQRLTPLDLGELSLSGPLFRITLGLSFW